ncbi:epimerase [Streptomyces sp. NPDC059761]|uniref:epimerase n=1 Tax=Streptomyces sp. NPDC059761 TaxID=3346937 RepID=UPI00364CA238
MNVILFGGTGMIGRGVLRECLRDDSVTAVLSVSRTPLGVSHPKLRERIQDGEGTDSTEQSRTMWARVKGEAENDLLQLPFQAYMFRPGLVQPVRGMPSKALLYRAGYLVTAPLFPLLRRLAPNLVTTTEALGRAVIAVARPDAGVRTRILRPQDINRLGRSPSDQR